MNGGSGIFCTNAPLSSPKPPQTTRPSAIATSGGREPSAAGSVVVADALPASVTIEADLVNPHYGEYYLHGKPPAGYWQPIPSAFLIVGHGSRFVTFVSGSRKEDVDEAVAAVKVAAEDHGIGGKTAAGYGYLTVEEVS